MYRHMKTVVEIIETLKVEGNIYDFCIRNNVLYCNSTENNYKAKDLIIDKTERYEGDSDPSDNVIVYGITAKDGSKGTLIDSYGVYSDPHFAILIDEIPLKEVHKLQDNK